MEQIAKFQPDRDLQVYFLRPSAIASISQATPNGFLLSGSWRQQFDWAVVEWNRDNVFEHPLFRSLPDGDISGLVLTYDEERTNCIPADSGLFPTVDWPYLRIWAATATGEEILFAPLKGNAVPLTGSYVCPKAQFTLSGTPVSGEYVGLAWLDEHHTYQVLGADTLTSIAGAIALSINTFSQQMKATSTGAVITLTYVGQGNTEANSKVGANGNRLGAYGHSSTTSLGWTPGSTLFSGGTSPTKWRYTINFSNLKDKTGTLIPVSKLQNVRKVRWTYAADLQWGAFQRSDFEVRVSNWSVAGANRLQKVAGAGSRRIEDDSTDIRFTGAWTNRRGNFSGGTISFNTVPGSTASMDYTCPFSHQLWLGTRYVPTGAQMVVRVDGTIVKTVDLSIAAEDVLCRISLGTFGPGQHSVSFTHNGSSGSYFYFDFLEIALPADFVTDQPAIEDLTLATDWDTDHSLALPAERTAWMIHSLGFRGRINHYAGALVFYEMERFNHQYASAVVSFTGTVTPSGITTVLVGPALDTPFVHLHLFGDTPAMIAKAFELLINNGSTGIRATSSGTNLTIYARALGSEGNQIRISASTTDSALTVTTSSTHLTGESDGYWRTDLAASPRLNKAARDWTTGFATASKNYGLDLTVAFSTELKDGDPNLAAGIAQRYPNGAAVVLDTPAIQTNFSPTSLAYWREVHSEMAGILSAVGIVPYLQLGEVQWWYFPLAGVGMTFYDAYTKSTFEAQYGVPMQTIPLRESDPLLYPNEVHHLQNLLGSFTSQLMSYVKAAHPNCRYEVLYPPDVNDSTLNTAVNYPVAIWTPANLDCLKTESFTYTFERDLNKCRYSVEYGIAKGFPASKRSFLVGIGDSTTTWIKEVEIAKSQNLESIVLFALDQFCLIGYDLPLFPGRRSSQQTAGKR